MDLKIIDINPQNIDEYQPTCYLNRKNEGHKIKQKWIKEQFAHGIEIKLLFDQDKKKIHGYVEYLPGEYAWRAVDAPGCLFVHCVWVTPNKLKNQGYGTALLERCIEDAKDKNGVAAITSDDTFMADRSFFIKNGFEVIQEDGKQQLVYRAFSDAPPPKIRDTKSQLAKYQGWNIVYSDQCPWVARFMDELDEALIKRLDLKITRIATPAQAQYAPSVYSAFNLIHDGKLLADHYISSTRLNNILKKHA